MVSIIAAVAENNAIGLKGKLLYWLPADLKRFKTLTTGHTIIMGRKTFESLPKGALPNRRNVVLTRSKQVFPGARRFPRLPKPSPVALRKRMSTSSEAQVSMPKPCRLPTASVSPKCTTLRPRLMSSSPASTAMSGKLPFARNMNRTKRTTGSTTSQITSENETILRPPAENP